MSSDKRNYYEKISLRNKTPEEAKIITENFNKNINRKNLWHFVMN